LCENSAEKQEEEAKKQYRFCLEQVFGSGLSDIHFGVYGVGKESVFCDNKVVVWKSVFFVCYNFLLVLQLKKYCLTKILSEARKTE